MFDLDLVKHTSFSQNRSLPPWNRYLENLKTRFMDNMFDLADVDISIEKQLVRNFGIIKSTLQSNMGLLFLVFIFRAQLVRLR